MITYPPANRCIYCGAWIHSRGTSGREALNSDQQAGVISPKREMLMSDTPRWFRVRPSYPKPAGGLFAIGPRYPASSLTAGPPRAFDIMARRSGSRSCRSSTSRRRRIRRSSVVAGSRIGRLGEPTLEPGLDERVIEPVVEHWGIVASRYDCPESFYCTLLNRALATVSHLTSVRLRGHCPPIA
jgi:hypothetical protein